jgi:transposase
MWYNKPSQQKAAVEMFLRSSGRKDGRKYLQIVHGYRDANGKPKAKVIKSLGYLDVLLKEYDDPIAHFKEVAKNMEAQRRDSSTYSIEVNANAVIDKTAQSRKNYGHIVFSKIYHELELDRFCNNKQRHTKIRYNTNSVLKLLTYMRLLYPCSKKKATELSAMLFDKFDFDLDDVYDALSHFNKHAVEMKRHIHERICEKYGRNSELVYYDVTNYYFETDEADGFRMRGASKEKRHDPIVQMGLAIDKNNIPITYKLFPGNTHDSQTLMPALAEVKREYGVGRIIVVADKGLNSGDNIAFNTALGDGYVFSQSVRGANAEFLEYVLNEKGYVEAGTDYKKKSRVIPAEIWITTEGKGKGRKKKKVKVDQKQVVFFSQKYADRAKRQREEVLKKAADLISNPSKYNSATSYGAAAYIKGLTFNKDTGEVIESERKLQIDMDKVMEDERLDGFYAIVSSELNETDEKIIDLYRGLWRIEESFKITKSFLSARPVYLSRQDHINAHFLTCFISLVILRIIEMRLDFKFPASRILETVRAVECSNIDANLWLFDYSDEITDALNGEFDLNFGRKFLKLQHIRESFGISKKI